eukprot:NODE_3185_length_818_cov_27.754915.p1 GENE.NODE_3185_length_818_cov_27.754915~~NODE_3185_length_818_cov_27.754915.p1  ORF type:complete len:220 (+),score=52.91 NODE_3185_length_818_cov_27.754915:3-662(+)
MGNPSSESFRRASSLDYMIDMQSPMPHSGALQPVAMTPRRRAILDSLGIASPEGQFGCWLGSDGTRPRDLELYQEGQYLLNLHAGMYLTHLTPQGGYMEIHCQLSDDLMTFKLDQCNGRMIVFPLFAVSKVYRVLQFNRYPPSPDGQVRQGVADHLIYVEFMRRKLIFVFKSEEDAQLFTKCMELIVHNAQRGSDSGSVPRPLSSDVRTANKESVTISV